MTDGDRNIHRYQMYTTLFMTHFFMLLLMKNGMLHSNRYLTVKLLASLAFLTNCSSIFLQMLRHMSKKSYRFVLRPRIYLQNGKKQLYIPFPNHKNGTVILRILVPLRY